MVFYMFVILSGCVYTVFFLFAGKMRMIFRRPQRKPSERVNSTAAIGTSDAETADTV